MVPNVPCTVSQHDVKRSLFTEVHFPQCTDRLVSLQHLHLLHFPHVNILAGLHIATAQQVHSLNIEFVDTLSLVFNGSVTVHRQSWHFPDNVGNSSVLFVAESTDEVVQGITLLPYPLRLNHHLL